MDNKPAPQHLQPVRSQRLAYTFLILGILTLVFSSKITNFMTGAFQPGGIYIPSPQYTFAQSEQKGGSLSHIFRIYNFRPTSITLTAEPDCGCTYVSWKTTTVNAFGWVDLTAKMDTPKVTPRGMSVALVLDSNALMF